MCAELMMMMMDSMTRKWRRRRKRVLSRYKGRGSKRRLPGSGQRGLKYMQPV
jgi:hypothetical protein